MTNAFDWHMPVAVHFGAGCADRLADALGARAAVVLAFEPAHALGLSTRWRGQLGDRLLDWVDVADGLEADPGEAPVEAHLAAIDRLFAFDTVEEIFSALEADGSDWAATQLATLRTKSPQSLKVTLRQLRLGADQPSFADNMALEYRLGARVVRSHDFQEGVRAVVIDKDNRPSWSPAELSGVSEADLDRLFAPLPADQAWTPLQP